MIACALERYQLAHGDYPETLDALVPQFIESIPNDVIGGKPPHYRRTEASTYLLYSIAGADKTARECRNLTILVIGFGQSRINEIPSTAPVRPSRQRPFLDQSKSQT